MRAGVKQVKNRLSYYLRRVREGERVEVTDRGRVVAELSAPRKTKKSQEQLLVEMEKAGLITRGTGRTSDFEPIKPRKPVRLSRLILQDRR